MMFENKQCEVEDEVDFFSNTEMLSGITSSFDVRRLNYDNRVMGSTKEVGGENNYEDVSFPIIEYLKLHNFRVLV